MAGVKRYGLTLLALGFVLGCGETTTTPMSSAGNGSATDGGASGMAQGGDDPSDAGGDATSSGGPSSGGTPSTSSGGMSQAGAPPDSKLEPIRVIRGDPEQTVWWDLTIRGVALDEYEGKIATVRLGSPNRPPERLGSGQATIQGGGFELSFPQVWEYSLYKVKLVYIDVDGNGSCDAASDPLFADARGAQSAELTVRGSGPRENGDFSRSEGAEYCAQFNSDWPSE